MNSDLITLMREEEVTTSNFLPTKKELKLSSLNFAEQLVDSGDYELTEIYSQALRLKESLTVVESYLKKALPEEDFEAYGLKGIYRSGGDTLNYKEDEVYCELKADLDARVELLKLAQKQVVLDTYGNEVPKVSTTPRKSSLAISF
jgi:hypothetical protein